MILYMYGLNGFEFNFCGLNKTNLNSFIYNFCGLNKTNLNKINHYIKDFI